MKLFGKIIHESDCTTKKCGTDKVLTVKCTRGKEYNFYKSEVKVEGDVPLKKKKFISFLLNEEGKVYNVFSSSREEFEKVESMPPEMPKLPTEDEDIKCDFSEELTPLNLVSFPEKKQEVEVAPFLAQHFVVVFNPLFNRLEDSINEKFKEGTQAHWFYNLLKDNCAKDEKNPSNLNYSYWGKLEAENVDGLDIKKYQSILEKNSKNQRPTHLYISDFNYLWCARIEKVFGKGELSEEELKKTLYFYQKEHKRVEIWFKVVDLVLISSTSRESCEYMDKLTLLEHKGVAYNPYLCELRYPLVVEDKSSIEHYLWEDEKGPRIIRDINPFVRHADLEAKIKFNINSYVIPQYIFDKIDFGIKMELVLAEALYFENSPEDGNDYRTSKKCQIFSHYAKILEMMIRTIAINYGSLKEDKFTLGGALQGIEELLENKISIFTGVEKKSQALYDLLVDDSFYRFLKTASLLRNEIVHHARLSNEDDSKKFIEHFRNVMLGVGNHGLINRIYTLLYPKNSSDFIPDFEKLNDEKLLKRLELEHKQYSRLKKAA